MIRRSLLPFGLALVGCGPALAADLPVPPEPEIVEVVAPRWSLVVAPYVWAAGIDGTVGAFGLPTVDVDASFSDIFEHLDFGAMLVTELRYDRFGIFTDLVYVKLSGSRGTPFGNLANSARLEAETLMFTGAGEYRIVDAPGVALDVMAGARLWSVDNEVSLQGGALGGQSASDGDTWVDPLIGAKARIDLMPHLFLSGWAMAGGFGVASEFMWDVWGGLGYEFNDRFSMLAGYRAMGVDYSNDGFVFDVIQSGPVFGGAIRF